ncbi:MAG TPA: hypothetical protein VFS43_34450 [Polyangiaceae bacterium]|nr:hypothetical protein [Polyangiaceae bacterium]
MRHDLRTTPGSPGPLLRLALYGGGFVLGSLTAWATTVALEGIGVLGRTRAAPAEASSAEAPPSDAAPSASEAPREPEAEASAGPAHRDEAPPTEAGRAIGVCVERAFAPGSFPEGWAGSFQFLCEESDPRRATHLLRSELIRAGGKRRVTPGMREWSMLGWYNMASFAAIRGFCCPQPVAPLRVPTVGSCPDLAKPLNELIEVVAGQTPRDPPRLWTIRESYRTAVHCLDRAGFQGYYDQWGVLRGGEDATYDTMLGRILEGAPSPAAPSASAPE